MGKDEKMKKVTTVTEKHVKEALDPNLKQRIYIGPNLSGLSTYTVIESGFTGHITEMIKKCKDIRSLFVPIEEMASAESRAKEKGTLEFKKYQNVLAFKNSVWKGE